MTPVTITVDSKGKSRKPDVLNNTNDLLSHKNNQCKWSNLHKLLCFRRWSLEVVYRNISLNKSSIFIITSVLFLQTMFKLLVIVFTKENFADNHVHNVLRLFDGWANLCFTANETWKVKPPKAYHFRKFGNIFKISKLHIMVAYCLFFLPKWKFFSTSKNLLKKTEIELFA